MAKTLLSRGHSVRIFDQWSSGLDGVETRIGSILDRSVIGNAVSGCDAVIHFAAMIGVYRTDSQPLECMDVNLQGAVSVFESCIKEKVKKIVFSSSSEIYGDAGGATISETDIPRPKSVYAISKLAAEIYLRAYAEKYDIKYSIVRFFNIYGLGQVAEFVVPRFVKAVLMGQSPVIFGTGKQIRCYCYVDDAAQGVYKVLISDDANGETFNIGNDLEPIFIKDLADKIIKISGKDIKGKFIELSESDRKVDREVFVRRPDLTKARTILDYQPRISLEEGLRIVLERGDIQESKFEPMPFDK